MITIPIVNTFRILEQQSRDDCNKSDLKKQLILIHTDDYKGHENAYNFHKLSHRVLEHGRFPCSMIGDRNRLLLDGTELKEGLGEFYNTTHRTYSLLHNDLPEKGSILLAIVPPKNSRSLIQSLHQIPPPVYWLVWSPNEGVEFLRHGLGKGVVLVNPPARVAFYQLKKLKNGPWEWGEPLEVALRPTEWAND
jgi:hypothetical protein